jgi:hypothetical protein
MNVSDLDANSVISSNTVVVATTDQVSSDLAGESVILNLKSGTYFGLNEAGSIVWSLIQQPKSVGEVCQNILQEYEVDPQTCEKDVQALLSDLLTAQLIEIRHAGDS